MKFWLVAVVFLSVNWGESVGAQTSGSLSASSKPALTVEPVKPELKIPRNQEDCDKQGGRWARHGMFPRKSCNPKTSDSGRVCTSSNQCQGVCVTGLKASHQQPSQERDQAEDSVKESEAFIKHTGTCTPYRFWYGCHRQVHEGEIIPVCVD
jgi:hypothetical protein